MRLSFILLSAVGAFIFQPWLWIALIAVQIANLIIGIHEHRWLPMALFVIGWLYCFLTPLISQYWPR